MSATRFLSGLEGLHLGSALHKGPLSADERDRHRRLNFDVFQFGLCDQCSFFYLPAGMHISQLIYIYYLWAVLALKGLPQLGALGAAHTAVYNAALAGTARHGFKTPVHSLHLRRLAGCAQM